MIRVTIANVLSWGSPCRRWPRARILAATGGRDALTPLEIADLPEVPAADKLWVLLRHEILTVKELERFACHCLGREITSYVDPYTRSRAARTAANVARGKAAAAARVMGEGESAVREALRREAESQLAYLRDMLTSKGEA